MRLALLAAALLSTATVAIAQTPPEVAMAPQHRWHEKAREILARTIAFQTVDGRNQSPEMADYLMGEFRAAGFTDVVVQRHDATASLILRWPAARPTNRRPILLMGHMDVVEARREDWSRAPFELSEADGYFYGRGVLDNKQGVVGVTAALLRLRAEGFRPDREIIVLFTGDEETSGNGADLAAGTWLRDANIEYALNSDAGGGGYLADGTALGRSPATGISATSIARAGGALPVADAMVSLTCRIAAVSSSAGYWFMRMLLVTPWPSHSQPRLLPSSMMAR